MLLPDQFILAAMQQPSRTAHLSKARQRWIEVHTRIWQVELREKSGRLVDPVCRRSPIFSLVRNVGLTIRSTCSYLWVGWLLAERDQHRCHDILAEEVPANPRRAHERVREWGRCAPYSFTSPKLLRTKSDIDPIPRIYRTARKSSSRLLTRRIDRYPSALHHTCIHNSVLMRL